MADNIMQEKWIKGVTITTTILAVMTAIAASRSAYCVAQTQVLTAQEGSKWAYYQAKSIKENLTESQLRVFELNVLGAVTAQQKKYLDQNVAFYKTEIARYTQEKETVKAEAEKVGKNNARVARQGNHFSLSVVFFQIAIMLTSVSILLKRKEMWFGGLVFGIIAAVLLANGVFLFF